MNTIVASFPEKETEVEREGVGRRGGEGRREGSFNKVLAIQAGGPELDVPEATQEK